MAVTYLSPGHVFITNYSGAIWNNKCSLLMVLYKIHVSSSTSELPSGKQLVFGPFRCLILDPAGNNLHCGIFIHGILSNFIS